MARMALHADSRRWWLGLALAAALLILAACGTEKLQGTRYDPVIPAPEFEGEGSNGQPFAIGDLRGKVVLLFFGYTFCPDICPTTLAKMTQVYGELGEQAQDVAVVLASLDPERDTATRLAEYVTAFHPDFLGVRISPERLEEVKKGYGVFSEKRVVDPNASAAGYLIDHTGWIYVIDPKGNLREVFALDATPGQIAADAAALAN
jgi:protein SCO1/2